jgi:hypothetical protein
VWVTIGEVSSDPQPKIFAAWLRPLYRQDWVVYLKPPFGGPGYVLQYLGRCTHRVAISNHRLVPLADGQVTFRWRDSAHHNEQKLMTLSVDEFLRRFLLHTFPKGLGATQEPPAEEHAPTAEDAPDLYRCPRCGRRRKVIERLTAAEIQLRSPPVVTAAA